MSSFSRDNILDFLHGGNQGGFRSATDAFLAGRRQRDAQRSSRRALPTGGSNPFSDVGNQITSLLNEQRAAAEANAEATIADRDAALSILSDRVGFRSDEYQSTFESLSEDPGDTPFANMLRGSIEGTLNNPDVFTEDEIQGFVSRSNEAAARAVQDAILSTRVDNAQRGVQGGVPQGQVQALTLQAAADAVANEGQIRFQAAEAREANRAFAQQLGVTFETATQQARNQRLATLSQFVSEGEVRDLELVTGMAEILANTSRENPDYSGYAAILVDVHRAAEDAIIQRENLALLAEQIRVQESLGIANIDAQNSLAQAQFNYNRTLSQLQDQLSDFERQLAESGG